MPNILVTAGATRVMIDKVRCITNIFRGRTGNAIAQYLSTRGHKVTLLTSCPPDQPDTLVQKCRVIEYRTYDDLYGNMEKLITTRRWHVIIHSAAISDYMVTDTLVYADPGGETQYGLKKIDSSTKIGSEHESLFLKLEKTRKIVDQIRKPWGWKGKLVKFKLQVGMSDEELVDVATKSMHHSKADIMVANCLEWCRDRAFIINREETIPVGRDKLPEALHNVLFPECTQ